MFNKHPVHRVKGPRNPFFLMQLIAFDGDYHQAPCWDNTDMHLVWVLLALVGHSLQAWVQIRGPRPKRRVLQTSERCPLWEPPEGNASGGAAWLQKFLPSQHREERAWLEPGALSPLSGSAVSSLWGLRLVFTLLWVSISPSIQCGNGGWFFLKILFLFN